MGTSTYTEDVATAICERIALGESLRRICSEKKMPAQATVFKWLREQPGFSEQYAQARELQAETMMDDILEIADETAFDTLLNDKGNAKANAEWIARSKLRVDARLKLMSQLAPKKYGAKVAVTVSENTTFDKLTDQELLDEIRKLTTGQ